MNQATIVRYEAKPECAEENAARIRDVYAELTEAAPDTIQYTTFQMDDGVSFLHVAIVDPANNPLNSSPAFAAFQAGLKDRLASSPTPTGATVVGSYGMGIE